LPFCFVIRKTMPVEIETSHVGVSRSLFSKLNGMYSVAKSYVPSVANSSLTHIENGVTSLIERNVSPKLVTSLESRLDNILTPHVDKFNKMTEFAQNIGDRANPTVKSVEKKINSTIEVVRSSKKRFDNLVENVKKVPQNLQDRATAIALDSIQRVDNVIDYIIPEDANAADDVKENYIIGEEKTSENEQKEPLQLPDNEQKEPLQLPDNEIDEIVQRSVVISSKNLLGKINKRIQKNIWRRVASAHGFVKRRTQVIHTNLVDYASTAMDSTVPDSVREMYDAVLKFPDAAMEVYAQLAAEGIVNAPEFCAALQQKMGDAWVESMGPAAGMYCKVVNGMLNARELASQTRDATNVRMQKLFERVNVMTHTAYTVTTGRAVIVFNKVVPQSVREAAIAYMNRLEVAADLSADDSFLRKYSSHIAAAVSLARDDLKEMCVRLYDPINDKWELQAKFDFGRSLVSKLTKVPTLDFSKVFGFFQGLLNLEQIKKMRDAAEKARATLQSRVEQVVGDVASVTSGGQKPDASNDESTTPMVVPLNVMAERVYANLRNVGGTVHFRAFLSTLQTEYEIASGQEWKNTLLNATRRIYSQLTAGDILDADVEETDDTDTDTDTGTEEDIVHDVSSASEDEEKKVQKGGVDTKKEQGGVDTKKKKTD